MDNDFIITMYKSDVRDLRKIIIVLLAAICVQSVCVFFQYNLIENQADEIESLEAYVDMLQDTVIDLDPIDGSY